MNDQDTNNQTEEPTVQPTLLPPRPVIKKPLWYRLARGAGLVVIAGGGVFTLVLATMPRLEGATRSARIKWRLRKEHVKAAIENSTIANDEIQTTPVSDAPNTESKPTCEPK